MPNPIYRTFGSYTYTDDELMGGKLDTVVSELRRYGWNTYGLTSRYNSWKRTTTYFLHCNTVD